jgi:hypothetical protein
MGLKHFGQRHFTADYFGPSWGLTYEAAQVDYGVVPRKLFKRDRKILVVIDGNRFLVPESELHKWVEDKTEETIKNVVKKPVAKLRKLKKAEKPVMETRLDDGWIIELIASANRKIMEAVNARIDDEDELLILLLAA